MFFILDNFLPLTPLTAQNIKISRKLKKRLDIIILHKCTKNHQYMLYCSLDMARDRCNCYLSFWAIFCPFISLTAQKMKISMKWIKCLKILSFYTIVPKIMIIGYTVPEIWCVTNVIVIFHFGLFFVLLMKKCLEISSFYTCVPKIMIWWCMVPEIWCATDGWTDKQTDGWQKWHVEVGAPPKKRKIKRFLYFYDYTIIQPSWI